MQDVTPHSSHELSSSHSLQEVTNKQNLFDSVSQDETISQDVMTHRSREATLTEVTSATSRPIVLNEKLDLPPQESPPVPRTDHTTSDSNGGSENCMHVTTSPSPATDDSAPDMVSSENFLDQTNDGIVSPASSESVFTVTRSKAEKAKERLSSIGLSEDVYHANLSTYYHVSIG